MSNPKTLKLADDLRKNCNLNGFCRPECRELLQAWEDNPCFHGEFQVLVKQLLALSHEGLEFLARLNSCLTQHSNSGHQNCNAD